MARLVEQIVGKTKSINTRLFKRLNVKQSVISPITTLKCKLFESKRAFNSLSLQLPWIELLPFTKHYEKTDDNKDKEKEEESDNDNVNSKKWKRWKYFSMTLGIYLCTEILFYFRCKYLEYYANNISVDIVRPNISHYRCEHLLDLALKYAGIYDGGYEGWLKLWFNECDIADLRRENILELFYWGFFVENYDIKKNNDSDDELKWRDEFVKNGLIELENRMNYKFPEGKNEKVSDRFNNKREIVTDYHSLTLYLMIGIFQIWSNLILKYYFNFQYEWINDMKVWYKKTENKTINGEKALLFLHGIGIGLGPYYYVLQELLLKNKTKPFMDMICMIEIPYITMDILHLLPWPFSHHSYITNKLPAQITDYINILDKMEIKMNNNKNEIDWTIIGHSYGTMIASNMYLQINDEDKKPRLILIDPACFCLSHPSTVCAFVTDIDDIIDNDQFMPIINARKLLAKELMISCNLRKYFHWYSLGLYPEELCDKKRKHIVVTSEKDNIVPLGLIKKGIKNINDNKDNDIIINHHTLDIGHGEWIWYRDSIKKVIETL